MQIRSKSGIYIPKTHHSLLLAHCEPKIMKQSLVDSQWLAVMRQEFETFIANKSWNLFLLPGVDMQLVVNGYFGLKRMSTVLPTSIKPN